MFAILSLALASESAFAQVKPIDYTEQNQSFDKDKLNKETWNNQDKIWQRAGETFQKKAFTPNQDANYLKEKELHLNDGTAAKNIQDKRSSIGKTFNPPELKSDFKQKWNAPSDNVFFENKSKNLSKKYDGKIDFTQMNQKNKLLKDHLEKIQEKSMQDINKYMFRASHSTDADLPVVKAGEQLHPNDDSGDTNFLEELFFNTRRTIKRAPINFDKDVNVGTISTRNSHQKEPTANTANQNTQKILPALVQDNSENKKQAVVGAPVEHKTKVMEKEFKKETSLFAPRSESGPIRATSKFKISVEVSD